jgi:hypothetical protein
MREDGVHHGLGESARERVLLARVKAAQERERAVLQRQDVVAEARSRARRRVAQRSA